MTKATCETYFLSYSRADQDFALRLAHDLRSTGISIWVDQLDIRPSEHWDRAIERAVSDCCGLVVILSPRSAASDNVADEISFAIDHGKSVLPVMIERCPLPLRITRMQVIDATGDYDDALRQCLATISGGELPPRAAQPTAAPKGVDDVEAIARAKSALIDILGPIAPMIVDKEASNAASVGDLYDRLAEHITNEHDRKRFAACAPMGRSQATVPAPSRPAAAPARNSDIPQTEIDRIATALTHYIGPMANIVARRESTGAGSLDELQQRLASRIGNERDRADFLRGLRNA